MIKEVTVQVVFECQYSGRFGSKAYDYYYDSGKVKIGDLVQVNTRYGRNKKALVVNILNTRTHYSRNRIIKILRTVKVETEKLKPTGFLKLLEGHQL